MLLKVFFAVVLLALLQSIYGVPNGRTGTWVVIVHNGTGKVVASDGTLWEFGDGEPWKQWIVYTKGQPPYYHLKTGLDGEPNYFPAPKGAFSRASKVMGTEDLRCSATQVKKVKYYNSNYDSQIWKIENGVTPIYNKCSSNNQLVVKQDGEWTRIYTTNPSNVKEGDENSLFEVVATEYYKANMMGKK